MITAAILLRLSDVIFSIIEVLLGLRIILRLFGANPNTPFVNWVYETTRPLLTPFSGIFPASVIQGGLVIDFTTIFALLIYGIIAYFVTEILVFSSFSSERYYKKLRRKYKEEEG